MCAHLVREVIVKTLTRPIELPEPPAPGDYDLEPAEAGDDE